MQDDHSSPEDADFGFMADLGFADARDVSTRDVRTWRLAALAAATCLVAIASAFVLLNLGGGGGSKRDVGLPIVTGGPSSPALISSPVDTGFPSLVVPSTPLLRTRSRRARATPTRTATPTKSAAPSTSARPTPPSSTPHTSQPPTTSPPPSTSSAPAPVVQLVQGAHDFRCGPQCYFLDVTLTNLPGGHHIVCEARSRHEQTARQFETYDTADPVSSGCSYAGNNDSVWVVVDGTYRSNTVTW